MLAHGGDCADTVRPTWELVPLLPTATRCLFFISSLIRPEDPFGDPDDWRTGDFFFILGMPKNGGDLTFAKIFLVDLI